MESPSPQEWIPPQSGQQSQKRSIASGARTSCWATPPCSSSRTSTPQPAFRLRAWPPTAIVHWRPNLTWRCYDDYLASLDAKYRKSAKQLAASLEKAGVSLGDIDDLSSYLEPIHALYLQVHHAATIRPVTIPSSHIPALQQALSKDSLRCCGAWQDGRLVGFVITLKSGTTAIGYFIGYDRELAATGAPLYLALLHRTIAHALELGCERLSLGRTALEPKARLGAKAVSLHLWTRHRVPAMNWLLRAILQGVSHEEAPERNPFKG
jgi:predicted N-acyltransferase